MTWIYFILADDRRIKIGKATDVAKRIAQLTKSTFDQGHKIELLAAVRGNSQDEKQLQLHFESCRDHDVGSTEVFMPSRELTNYIRWVRDQWFAMIDVNDVPMDDGVLFENWKPADGREKHPALYPLHEDLLDFPDRVKTGDDYYTHPEILSRVHRVMDGIDLDPASHAEANENVKARKIFTKRDNGLNQPWYGNVWINPPFSEWKAWTLKVCSEWEAGDIKSMCVYAAMRTLTAKYFRRILDMSKCICIITGRYKHGGHGGNSPDDGHCVLYVGLDADKFIAEFSEIGSVWASPTNHSNSGSYSNATSRAV